MSRCISRRFCRNARNVTERRKCRKEGVPMSKKIAENQPKMQPTPEKFNKVVAMKNKEIMSVLEGKYGRYYNCNYGSFDPWWYHRPGFDRTSIVEILAMDDTTVPVGCHGFPTTIAFKVKADEECGRPPYMHADSAEYIGYCTTDPYNPDELGAEIEFQIGDEIHVITRPCYVYIPKGLTYGPVKVTKMTRPFIEQHILPDAAYYGNDLDEINGTYEPPVGTRMEMNDGKYGKLFVPGGDGASGDIIKWWYNTPDFDPTQYKNIAGIDAARLPGGARPISVGFQYKLVPEPEGTGHPQNYHTTSDEVIMIFGSDWEHPHDLGGEVEMGLGDEMHLIDKPCILFVPKGMPHGPMWFRKIDKPMIQSVMLPTAGVYESTEASDD